MIYLKVKEYLNIKAEIAQLHFHIPDIRQKVIFYPERRF